MYKKIFFSTLLLCTFFSCKKNHNNNSNCDKTPGSIAGTYSIVKYEVGLNDVFQDFTNELDVCELDDKISLKADGTTMIQDVGVICSPPGNSTGTWAISANNKITINNKNGGPTDITSADIRSFNCTTLVLTGSDPRSPSDQFRLTLKK